MVHIDVISSRTAYFGRGAYYVYETESLFYADFNSREATINRFDIEEKIIFSASVEDHRVRFVIPVVGSGNEFAVGIGNRVEIINWDGKSSNATIVRNVLETEENFEFIHAAVDPRGRLLAEAERRIFYPDETVKVETRLYSVAKEKDTKLLQSDVPLSNGFTWNVFKNKFYWIDGFQIKEFDYDADAGDFSNEKVVVEVNGLGSGCYLSGLNIDDGGNLYTCAYGASKVLKINPETGEVEQELQVPLENITSLAFGGRSYEILFVTSASYDEQYREGATPGGSLLLIGGPLAKGLGMNRALL